eukprot:scaffold125947_cov15-Tisochrysis_lutea.AAC.1
MGDGNPQQAAKRVRLMTCVFLSCRQEQLKQPTASKEQRGFALHEQGATTDEDNVQIEYVSAPLDLGTSEKAEEPQPDEEAEGMGYGLGLGFSKPKEDPYADFKRIFERFATAEQVTGLERLGEESDEEGAGKGGERTVKEEQRATSTAPEEDEDGGQWDCHAE